MKECRIVRSGGGPRVEGGEGGPSGERGDALLRGERRVRREVREGWLDRKVKEE